jgi:hypothetical protein
MIPEAVVKLATSIESNYKPAVAVDITAARQFRGIETVAMVI